MATSVPLPRGRGASTSAVDVDGTAAGTPARAGTLRRAPFSILLGRPRVNYVSVLPAPPLNRKLSKEWGNPRTEGKVNDPAGASARLCTLLLRSTPHELTARVSPAAIIPQWRRTGTSEHRNCPTDAASLVPR